MNLLTSLRSEILKTKRTSSLYLALVAAAFGPFMSLLDLVFDGVSADDGKIIFEKMFTVKFQMTSFVIFPIFLMLICTLLPQVEYKNNAWKQVLASPQSKGNVYVAKFINMQLLIVVFLASNQLLMFADAVILHIMKPSLHVLNQPINGFRILVTLANSYVAVLAMCSIQFWLGLRFKNFIVPITVGLASWFIGSILVLQLDSGLASYFPYSFHVYGSFPKYASRLNTIGWTSSGYAVLFLVVGFLDFKRRRMNA